MTQKALQFLLVLTFFVFSDILSATHQIGDKLIVGLDTSWIETFPLEGYLDSKGNRKLGGLEPITGCTALWRGYSATWLIENDSLFLVSCELDVCSDNAVDVDLNVEFGSRRVFAEWFSYKLTMNIGAELIGEIFQLFPSYEGMKKFTIRKGVVIDVEEYQFLIRESGRVFPGEKYLQDTLESILLGAAHLERNDLLENSSYLKIAIRFDSNGVFNEVIVDESGFTDKISCGIIRREFTKELRNFPPLMKVGKKWSYPRVANLVLSGYQVEDTFRKSQMSNLESHFVFQSFYQGFKKLIIVSLLLALCGFALIYYYRNDRWNGRKILGVYFIAMPFVFGLVLVLLNSVYISRAKKELKTSLEMSSAPLLVCDKPLNYEDGYRLKELLSEMPKFHNHRSSYTDVGKIKMEFNNDTITLRLMKDDNILNEYAVYWEKYDLTNEQPIATINTDILDSRLCGEK